MPRPLSSFKPGGGVVMGNTGMDFKDMGLAADLYICNSHSYPVEHRPAFVPLAMRIISAWSTLDSYVARIVATMVGGSSDVAIAMYNSLGSTATQQTVLKAAAAESLPVPQGLMLAALLLRHNEVAKCRNRVAHHLWGISVVAPAGVILLDPKNLDKTLGDLTNVRWEQIPVFDENDFIGWIADIEELSGWFHEFYFMIGPRRNEADSILNSLEAVPRLAKLLRKSTNRPAQAAPDQPSAPAAVVKRKK